MNPEALELFKQMKTMVENIGVPNRPGSPPFVMGTSEHTQVTTSQNSYENIKFALPVLVQQFINAYDLP